MPSPVVGAQATAIVSRTELSIASSFRSKASDKCVKHDQIRFSPVGVGPTSPFAGDDTPILMAIDRTQSSMIDCLTSPCIRMSVGPRSSGTPIVQNHQFPVGIVYVP